MTTIKGPGIFLAQFLDDKAPFNNLRSICLWAESLGFIGVQIPTWDPRCMDLQKAAESKTYADELKGLVEQTGMKITELSTHLQGQLVAVHPAYDDLFDGFAPENVRKNPTARTEWAVQQLKWLRRLHAIWALTHMQLLVVHCYGLRFIPGPSGRQGWWKQDSKNLPG